MKIVGIFSRNENLFPESKFTEKLSPETNLGKDTISVFFFRPLEF